MRHVSYLFSKAIGLKASDHPPILFVVVTRWRRPMQDVVMDLTRTITLTSQAVHDLFGNSLSFEPV